MRKEEKKAARLIEEQKRQDKKRKERRKKKEERVTLVLTHIFSHTPFSSLLQTVVGHRPEDKYEYGCEGRGRKRRKKVDDRSGL